MKESQFGPYCAFTPDPKVYIERERVKRIATFVGMPCIFVLLFSYVLKYVLLAIALIFPSFREAFTAAAASPATEQALQIVLSLLLFTVPFIISCRKYGRTITETVPFSKPEGGHAVAYFFMGLGFCAFANMASGYLSSFFEGMGFEYSMPSSALPQGIYGFLLCVIATAVMPALAEEFAFRGILQGMLLPFGEGFSIIVSAVFFGVMHGNFVQIPFAFTVGLILGYIRVKTGSVRICMAVHFANNLVSVLLDFFSESLAYGVGNAIYILFLVLSLALGAAAALTKGIRQDIKVKESDMRINTSSKYLYMFTNPAVIVFAVIALLESLRWLV